MACCDDHHCHTPPKHMSPVYRRVLIAALVINAGMFGVEVVAGSMAESRALLADALDFLGDAANYAISLYVLGMSLMWRARAALLKGASMLVFALWVLWESVHGLLAGIPPEPVTMGVVGALALAANVSVAVMLYRFREGDSNMQSVWICSRNDAIGNVAVMLAAGGVAITHSAWPDVLVAAGMALLALSGSIQILRQARRELTVVPVAP